MDRNDRVQKSPLPKGGLMLMENPIPPKGFYDPILQVFDRDGGKSKSGRSSGKSRSDSKGRLEKIRLGGIGD